MYENGSIANGQCVNEHIYKHIIYLQVEHKQIINYVQMKLHIYEWNYSYHTV